MSEPTIICPNCKTEIKLTESLAAPLIESTRRDYEKRLAQKDTDIAKKEESLREREAAVSKATQAIDDQVAEKLLLERAKIVTEESKKAKLALQTDIDQKTRELAELQDVLNQREVKLAEAQKAQADLIRQKRELDDAKRELELTVEKRVQDGLSATREQAKKEAEEGLKHQSHGGGTNHRLDADTDRRTQAQGRTGIAAAPRRSPRTRSGSLAQSKVPEGHD